VTFLDARLIELLFRKGGVKRSDLEGFPRWKDALRSIATRNEICRKVVDGEKWFFVKGRE